jgi:hypothetical protein
MARSQQEIQMLRERGNTEMDIKRQSAAQDNQLKAKSASGEEARANKASGDESSTIKALVAALTKPRKIVRGKDGRAAGIE